MPALHIGPPAGRVKGKAFRSARRSRYPGENAARRIKSVRRAEPVIERAHRVREVRRDVDKVVRGSLQVLLPLAIKIPSEPTVARETASRPETALRHGSNLGARPHALCSLPPDEGFRRAASR
jgi:hypothetical protein